ncbi:hypothetical protein BD309DRAFT_968459 [Dichomitus squalens]|uniref:Uncharacterized protein n=1 Tax=Dichomitus squalens TaxID=114155 RepID=A0A4Q9PEL8_9APHY|nr:hypothetical protein BD309DRAFT_968459 [Dichomitus squalens]TBU53364.1 hypothetical protein BD310DRAFT_938190 [Dichomitus squalens]
MQICRRHRGHGNAVASWVEKRSSKGFDGAINGRSCCKTIIDNTKTETTTTMRARRTQCRTLSLHTFLLSRSVYTKGFCSCLCTPMDPQLVQFVRSLLHASTLVLAYFVSSFPHPHVSHLHVPVQSRRRSGMTQSLSISSPTVFFSLSPVLLARRAAFASSCTCPIYHIPSPTAYPSCGATYNHSHYTTPFVRSLRLSSVSTTLPTLFLT